MGNFVSGGGGCDGGSAYPSVATLVSCIILERFDELELAGDGGRSDVAATCVTATSKEVDLVGGCGGIGLAATFVSPTASATATSEICCSK